MTSAMGPILLVLLLSICLPKFAVEGVGSEVLSRRMCMSLSTKPLPVARIRTYTINEGPMRAVIFITKRGIKVCADPETLWVKKAMKGVDRTRSRSMTQMSSSGTQNPTSMARTLNA